MRLMLALSLPTAIAGAIAHYPPRATSLNNLNYALNGPGTNGVYNSSWTSIDDYGTYNYCNMPHVRQREYVIPPSNYSLQYVEVIQRHHKRTPYASNTFPKEDATWDCNDVQNMVYARPTSDIAVVYIAWNNFQDPLNPFSPRMPGSCQLPQITFGGLQDSWVHGQDLRSVYNYLLQFVPEIYDPDLIQFRVTSNTITSQVAGALIAGMFPLATEVSVFQEMDASDSLRPGYPCPAADRLLNSYLNNANWTRHLTAAQGLFSRLDGVSGIPSTDGGWHSSFDHYFDNFSSKQCHQKALPCSSNGCISQNDADAVYRMGQYEYSYMYRDAPQSTRYAALKYGAYLSMLSQRLQAKTTGADRTKYRHSIAHDGSLSLLLGALQIDQMVWPGTGAEVVFELWKDNTGAFFVRVLWSGKVMKTSTPMGSLNMVPLQTFVEYLQNLVGGDIVGQCA